MGTFPTSSVYLHADDWFWTRKAKESIGMIIWWSQSFVYKYLQFYYSPHSQLPLHRISWLIVSLLGTERVESCDLDFGCFTTLPDRFTQSTLH